jgi:hypothetical protein
MVEFREEIKYLGTYSFEGLFLLCVGDRAGG